MNDIVKKMLDDAKNAAKEFSIDNFQTALYVSRQTDMKPLSPWMDNIFKKYSDPLFYMYKDVGDTVNLVISQIVAYSKENRISDYVIGLSGGADSAVCYALLKEVQKEIPINIHAYALPIHQKEAETNLAQELVDHYKSELKVVDLTNSFDALCDTAFDLETTTPLRQGNLRARLRMMYLYDVAHAKNGIVVSTDNFSEYSAGFWTINGDVGDIAPLRNFYKSVEVPLIGKHIGLPEKFWRVVPTDGLGISSSDEEQLGMSYLEWDILTTAFVTTVLVTSEYLIKNNLEQKIDYFYISENMYEMFSNDIKPSSEDLSKVVKCMTRIYGSWFKRKGTINMFSGGVNKTDIFKEVEDIAVIPYSAMSIDKLLSSK